MCSVDGLHQPRNPNEKLLRVLHVFMQVTADTRENLRILSTQLGSLPLMFDDQLRSLHRVETLLNHQTSRQDVNHEEVTCLLKEVLARCQLLGRPMRELQAEETLILADSLVKTDFEQYVFMQVQ